MARDSMPRRARVVMVVMRSGMCCGVSSRIFGLVLVRGIGIGGIQLRGIVGSETRICHSPTMDGVVDAQQGQIEGSHGHGGQVQRRDEIRRLIRGVSKRSDRQQARTVTLPVR